MRRKRISETIDNINPMYIDEAAEYTGKAKTTAPKVWYKSLAVAACFALVLAIGVWQNDLFQTRKPAGLNEDNTSLAGTQNPDSDNDVVIVTPDTPVIWGTVSGESQDMAYAEWNGKRVTLPLYTVLSDEKNKNSIIAVGIGFERNDDFVYNGKSLAEYETEAENAQLHFNKLGELLKLGDELKYGEALYETGTPDGKRWAKQLYDETVKRIGKDVLDKYIVDGEFQREKLESDIAQDKEYESCRAAYDEAVEAYYDFVAKQTSEQLREQNINSEVRDGLIVYVTVAELASLEIDNVLFYSLALKDGEGEDMEEISTDDVATETLTQFTEKTA